MADTVKVPGIGPMKKGYVFAAVGISGLIVVYMYRKNQANSAASTTASTSGTVDPSAIDPNSPEGYTYAQESAMASNNSSMYSGGYTSGANITGYTQGGEPVYGVPATASAAASAYQTNADWTSAAVDELAAEGVTISAATTAIANILGGLPVTVAQEDLFLQAKGLLGTGPPNGYPTIRLTDTPGTGGNSGSGSTGTGSTGTGTGAAPSTPSAPHAPSGLSASASSKTAINAHWNASSGAKSYQVRITYQSSVTKTQSVSGTSVTISGLTPDHTYGVHVIAVGAGNKWSPEASATAHTPR